LVFASFGALLASCSALGLGEHDLFACDPDDENACSDLNVPGQCPRYHCHPEGGCAPDEIVDERCDGLDNNCNELIDEGLVDPSYESETFAIDLAFDHVAHAVLPEGTAHFALTAPATSDGKFETTHVTLLDQFDEGEPILDAQQCDRGGEFVTCQISQLALAATSNTVVGAGIHRLGCGAGQLRIGAGGLPHFGLRLGGDDDPGTAVDLEPSGCSLSAPTCEGASDPAVALLEPPGGTPEALFVWLAPLADDLDECAQTGEYQLTALSAAVSASAADSRLLLSSRPSVMSQRLGEGSTSGPAALLASTRSDALGFFAAFPSQDRVEVLFVPRRGEQTRIADSFTQVTIDAPGARDVALARGGDEARTLAVAYHATMNGDPVVQLALVVANGQAPPGSGSISAIRTFQPKGALTAGPVVAFAPSGFVDAGAPGPHGGWLVSWVEQETPQSEILITARVAERGSQVLDDRIVLAQGIIRAPFTYSKHERDGKDAIRVGHLNNDALQVTTVMCSIDN
jgi:hypothetical protein